jgi:hypothetical protein
MAFLIPSLIPHFVTIDPSLTVTFYPIVFWVWVIAIVFIIPITANKFKFTTTEISSIFISGICIYLWEQFVEYFIGWHFQLYPLFASITDSTQVLTILALRGIYLYMTYLIQGSLYVIAFRSKNPIRWSLLIAITTAILNWSILIAFGGYPQTFISFFSWIFLEMLTLFIFVLLSDWKHTTLIWNIILFGISFIIGWFGIGWLQALCVQNGFLSINMAGSIPLHLSYLGILLIVFGIVFYKLFQHAIVASLFKIQIGLGTGILAFDLVTTWSNIVTNAASYLIYTSILTGLSAFIGLIIYFLFHNSTKKV